MKQYGKQNDLLSRIEEDPAFGLTEEELQKIADPSAFTGMAARQCEDYLRDVIRPLLAEYADEIRSADEINV